MSSNQGVSRSGGVGFFGLLAIGFIVLKLTGNLTWSWWWVLAPLWVPTLIVMAVFFLAVVMHMWLKAR